METEKAYSPQPGYLCCINFAALKAVSHDATSLMRFGFMKLVSPCDRAKHVSQDTFKSPVRLFLL